MIIPTLILLTQSALADSFNMKLALTESDPKPGDSITFEVRLTNTNTKPIQIPADWTERLELLAWREPPGQKPTPRQVASTMEARLLQAKQLKWITVEPSQTLTHQLPLTIDACAEGCVGGSYYGQVTLGWDLIEGAKPNQETPKEAVSFNFDVRLPLTNVTSGVSAAVTSVSPPSATGDLTGTLALTNDTGAPLWIANPDQWLAGCEALDKKGNSIGVTMLATGGQSRFLSEDGYALVAPGGAVSVPFACAGIIQGKLPGKSTLTVSISPLAPFYPIQPQDVASVLTGTVASTEPALIPKK